MFVMSPIKPAGVFLFSILCLLSVLAADLKTFGDVYQKETQEILQSFQPKFDGLQQQYQKSLETLKTFAQNKGDFKTTKAAVDEIERFQKAKTLPAAPNEAEIPEIKVFQAAYTKQFSVWELDMTAKLGALTARYEQALNRLLTDLTKAGKLDEAAAVNREHEQAQAALKGYADQLATLKGPSATNAARAPDPRTPAAAPVKPAGSSDLYMVIDLSRGMKAKEFPVTYLSDVPKGRWTDEYKTDKLVLRRIEPGTFKMGSPENELGRGDIETQHEVTLTQGFYIGVFEVTQKQWERVTGNWPTGFSNSRYRDTRPVVNVCYDDIRGIKAGACWPATNSVDSVTLLGRLRTRTGRMFDLPTEAQWEFACRAGTSTALNSGENLTDVETCPRLSELGRYKANCKSIHDWEGDPSGGTAKVGSFRPNAWGLYDMHGNAREWCLDWMGRYKNTEIDPKGAASDDRRICRGGALDQDASACRSASRGAAGSKFRIYSGGFRIVVPFD